MSSAWQLEQIAQKIRSGAVIAYPTEAVWGLGCDPFNAAAVARLLALKDRPMHKGLILVAASIEQFAGLLEGLTPEQSAQLEASWPGPNTWLVPHHNRVPEWVTGAHDTVAIRVSAGFCRRKAVYALSSIFMVNWTLSSAVNWARTAIPAPSVIYGRGRCCAALKLRVPGLKLRAQLL